MSKLYRCQWAENELFHSYHDTEWGVPVHNDKIHFEFLVLESAQAGLSWSTILKRRGGYKKAFANFDVNKVAKFSKKDIERLLENPEIIRNRMKIEAAINNAKMFVKIQDEFFSFDRYIWEFVNNKPVKNSFKHVSEIPANTPLSDKISKDLKTRGFKFVGSTIIYAHMQATGIVNDHEIGCFRYEQV